jgi:hypothetical protein
MSECLAVEKPVDNFVEKYLKFCCPKKPYCAMQILYANKKIIFNLNSITYRIA